MTGAYIGSCKMCPCTYIRNVCMHVCMYICSYSSKLFKITLSYIVVAMYSRDRYEIIRLHKISHFIKQP